MKHVVAVLRRWSFGDCFGEVTAVPSDELEPQDPVGLGGWGFRAEMASCTSLKSNTLSEKVTGADMGITDEGPVSTPSMVEPNTALERGEYRIGRSVHGNASKPPSKGALSGGLALGRSKGGNWNILEGSDVLRAK